VDRFVFDLQHEATLQVESWLLRALRHYEPERFKNFTGRPSPEDAQWLDNNAEICYQPCITGDDPHTRITLRLYGHKTICAEMVQKVRQINGRFILRTAWNDTGEVTRESNSVQALVYR